MIDTPTRYGTMTRALHALIGGLVIAQFLAAAAKRIWGKENPFSEVLSPFHGDIGLMILFLVVVRICWAIGQRANRPKPTMNRTAVTAVHSAMYALMLLVPIAGLMISFGAGRGIDLLGLQMIPAGNELTAIKDAGRALHKPLAWLFGALVAGHIGAAYYHRFVRKDGVMERMFSTEK